MVLTEGRPNFFAVIDDLKHRTRHGPRHGRRAVIRIVMYNSRGGLTRTSSRSCRNPLKSIFVM